MCKEFEEEKNYSIDPAYFFSETKFSETDTFFPRPNFQKPKPRLFFPRSKSPKPILKPSKNWKISQDRDRNRDFSISLTIFGEIFSKYFPSFPSLFFFSSGKKIIFLLRIFSSFFFSVFLLLWNRTSRQRSKLCFPPCKERNKKRL